jgi:F-type H+-transporting ATPase subunit delta
MTTSVVANRYARALMELASESGQISLVAQQLRQAADAYLSSEELRSVLGDPTLEDEKRAAVIAAIGQRLGLNALVQNTLGVLLVRGRMTALPDVAQRLMELADEQAGLVQASVASATPLSDSQLQSLKGELERLTGCKIALERRHEPNLLAGVVARVGDHVIDASLRGRFQELEQKLLDNPNA